MEHFIPGQAVTVLAAGNRELVRVVAEDRGDVILICTEEEFKRASAEHRELVTIGFNRKYVRAATGGRKPAKRLL